MESIDNLGWYRSFLDIRKETLQYVPTGFPSIDKLIDGWYHGTLNIIAARPGKGKTTSCINFLSKLIDKEVCVWFGTETRKERLIDKLISIREGLPDRRIRAGEDIDKVRRFSERLEGSKLFIEDKSAPSFEDVQRAVDIYEPKIVCIDYFQNMNHGLSKYRAAQSAYADTVKQLGNLSKDRKIIIIMASQLRRPPEERRSQRPLMSDLKETGEQEQVADTVMLLWGNEPRDEYLNIDITKARDRSIGDVQLRGMWDCGVLIDTVS